MMRQIQWPAILILLAWVIVIAIIFGYDNLINHLGSDWMTIVVWLMIPMLIISLIVGASGHHASQDGIK